MIESYSIEGMSHYESIWVKHKRSKKKWVETSRYESLMYSKEKKRWTQPHTWLGHVVEECVVRKESGKIVTVAVASIPLSKVTCKQKVASHQWKPCSCIILGSYPSYMIYPQGQLPSWATAQASYIISADWCTALEEAGKDVGRVLGPPIT